MLARVNMRLSYHPDKLAKPHYESRPKEILGSKVTAETEAVDGYFMARCRIIDRGTFQTLRVPVPAPPSQVFGFLQ